MPDTLKRSLAVRLAEKIKKDTGAVCDPASFQRNYPSRYMKQAGAFAWEMKIAGHYFHTIGSVWPATELLKKKYYLELVNDEIFPEKKDGE